MKRHQEDSPGLMGRRRWRASRPLVAVAAASVMLGATAVIPVATSSANPSHTENAFHQTNLVSDLKTVGAKLQDTSLKNPWGLALGTVAGKTFPLWVADNNHDVATIYPGDVSGSPITKAKLEVSIPGGAPTGEVFNPTSDFVVDAAKPDGPARFIFASENGDITAWNPSTTSAPQPTTAELKFSNPASVYKGLAIATTLNGSFLYASNFHDGTVDVFDTNFKKMPSPGGFSDPAIPAGYAPFGIQNIHGLIYVTYALQNALKHDDLKGPGHGFIDVYTTDGFLVRRLATRGVLNSPWGLTVAPPNFGPFGGKLLVGNFGDGRINVFDSLTGTLVGKLRNESNDPITINGLWGLIVGNAATGGTNTVLFSAGINDEVDGLVGALNPAG